MNPLLTPHIIRCEVVRLIAQELSIAGSIGEGDEIRPNPAFQMLDRGTEIARHYSVKDDRVELHIAMYEGDCRKHVEIWFPDSALHRSIQDVSDTFLLPAVKRLIEG